MGLINVPDIENLDAATPDLWNTRFGTIVDVINGNLSSDNLASGAVTAAKLATGAVTEGKIDDLAVTSRKAVLDIVGVQGTDLNPLTTSYQDTPSASATFSVNVDSYILLSFGARLQMNTALTASLKAVLDGTDITDALVEAINGTSSAMYIPGSRTIRVDLTAGSHTIKLQAKATVGSAAVAIAPYWWGLVVAQP